MKYQVVKTGFNEYEVRDYRGFTVKGYTSRAEANNVCIALLNGKIKEQDL